MKKTIDREKVIKALECCATHDCYKKCPYSDIKFGCRALLMKDTIAILKEHDSAEIELEGGGSSWWHVCGECHGAVDESDKFCKHCGRPLICLKERYHEEPD
jgi:hypothetical protein